MSKTILDDPERAARVAWRRAFDEQLTNSKLKRVRKYAEKRVRVMANVLGRDKQSGAIELVHDAIAATLDGTRRWDPAGRSLDNHLINVIRAQTTRAAERLARNPQRSLDDTRDDTSSDGCPLENKATMQREPAVSSPVARDVNDAASRLVANVRELAADDRDVLRLVDALRAGVDDGDVTEASGLNPARYRNARRRLTRLIARLPTETRAAVDAVL